MYVNANDEDDKVLKMLKSEYLEDINVLKSMIPMFAVNSDTEKIFSMGISMLQSIQDDLNSATSLDDLRDTFDVDGIKRDFYDIMNKRMVAYSNDSANEQNNILRKYDLDMAMNMRKW